MFTSASRSRGAGTVRLNLATWMRWSPWYATARSEALSRSSLRRMEAGDGPVRGNYGTVAAVVAALEAAGVEFTNGSQPGVRLRSIFLLPNECVWIVPGQSRTDRG